jgi:hypothetical protein
MVKEGIDNIIIEQRIMKKVYENKNINVKFKIQYS